MKLINSRREKIALIAVVTFFSVLLILLFIANRAEKGAEEPKKAAEQKTEEYVKLCQNLKMSAPNGGIAHGPAWYVALYGDSLDYLQTDSDPSKSLMPAGTAGHAQSIHEAKALVCVFEEKVNEVTCDYGADGATLAHTTRVFLHITATLVDTQSKDKIAEFAFSSDPPECPRSMTGVQDTLYGSESVRRERIANWVKVYLRP